MILLIKKYTKAFRFISSMYYLYIKLKFRVCTYALDAQYKYMLHDTIHGHFVYVYT